VFVLDKYYEQVIINIKQNNAGIAFGYVGVSWKFGGEVSIHFIFLNFLEPFCFYGCGLYLASFVASFLGFCRGVVI
jgi:hypothetical protein